MGSDEAYTQLDRMRGDYLRGYSTDRGGLSRAKPVKATDLLLGVEALLDDRATDLITPGDKTGELSAFAAPSRFVPHAQPTHRLALTRSLAH